MLFVNGNNVTYLMNDQRSHEDFSSLRGIRIMSQRLQRRRARLVLVPEIGFDPKHRQS